MHLTAEATEEHYAPSPSASSEHYCRIIFTFLASVLITVLPACTPDVEVYRLS